MSPTKSVSQLNANLSILQSGQAKSGNYWVWKIIQNVLENTYITKCSFIQNHPIHALAVNWELSHADQANIDVIDIEPTGCFFRIGSIFKMPIEDIDSYVRQCSHVWTHSQMNSGTREVLPKFDKAVYIIRDPRDVALSMAKFAFTPYMQKHYPTQASDPGDFLDQRFANVMASWVRHVGGYLRHQREFGFHVLFYERLLTQFDAELTNLLSYLGIDLDADARQAIHEETAFGSMKRTNPDHVQKGKAGKWVQELSKARKKQALRVAGPMLELLNYPTVEPLGSTPQPQIPEGLDRSDIDKALRRAKRYQIYTKAKQAYTLLR